jgi:thiamine pyrophosphokinase
MIEKVPSQYATDLQKCILRVEEYEEKGSVGEMELIILGGLSGRLDQTMHTLHVLCQLTMTDGQQAAKVSSSQKRAHLEQDDFAVLNRRKRTWVFSENSLVWVLGKVGETKQVE